MNVRHDDINDLTDRATFDWTPDDEIGCSNVVADEEGAVCEMVIQRIEKSKDIWDRCQCRHSFCELKIRGSL